MVLAIQRFVTLVPDAHLHCWALFASASTTTRHTKYQCQYEYDDGDDEHEY